MKLFIIICGFGLIQCCINNFTAVFKAPPAHTSFFLSKDETVDDIWECNRCGHTNYKWTSICCRCGRHK